MEDTPSSSSENMTGWFLGYTVAIWPAIIEWWGSKLLSKRSFHHLNQMLETTRLPGVFFRDFFGPPHFFGWNRPSNFRVQKSGRNKNPWKSKGDQRFPQPPPFFSMEIWALCCCLTHQWYYNVVVFFEEIWVLIWHPLIRPYSICSGDFRG